MTQLNEIRELTTGETDMVSGGWAGWAMRSLVKPKVETGDTGGQTPTNGMNDEAQKFQQILNSLTQ